MENPMSGLDESMRRLTDTMHKRNNPAGFMLERLNAQLHAFQSKMTEDAEVGMVAIGGSGTFHLRRIRVSNPDMLIFDGIDESGRTMQLIQHHTQMSVMFIELPKLEAKPFRIGFVHSDDVR